MARGAAGASGEGRAEGCTESGAAGASGEGRAEGCTESAREQAAPIWAGVSIDVSELGLLPLVTNGLRCMCIDCHALPGALGWQLLTSDAT